MSWLRGWYETLRTRYREQDSGNPFANSGSPFAGGRGLIGWTPPTTIPDVPDLRHAEILDEIRADRGEG